MPIWRRCTWRHMAALGRQSEAVANYRRLVARGSGQPRRNPYPGDCVECRQTAARKPSASCVRHSRAYSTDGGAALHACSQPPQLWSDSTKPSCALRECVRLEPRRAEAHDRLAQLIWMRTGRYRRGHAHSGSRRSKNSRMTMHCGAPRPPCCRERETRAALTRASPNVPHDPSRTPACSFARDLAALEFEPATALTLAQRALRALPNDHTARRLLCAAYLGVGERGQGAGRVRDAAGNATAGRSIPHCHADHGAAAVERSPLRERSATTTGWFCRRPSKRLPGWPDLASFLTELTSRLSALHNPHGHRLLYQSLRQGTETTQDLSRSQDPVIQALFRAFAAPIARYRDHIGQGEDALRRRNRGPTRFNGGWSVRLHSDGYHTSHVHPRGWISSACYIQLPDCMSVGTHGRGNLQLRRAGHADDAITTRASCRFAPRLGCWCFSRRISGTARCLFTAISRA